MNSLKELENKKKKSVNKKYNVILDLDNTLISGEPSEHFNFKKQIIKANKFDFETMEDYYIIFSRPHLQKFLTFLFNNFNVSVWTAASKDYALFIIENIILKGKKNRKIDFIFFSYHCNISKKLTKNTKKLSILWDTFKIKNYNENNTFIFDDYKEDVYDSQKENCILAKIFEYTSEGSESDIFLLNLIQMLKKMLKQDETKFNNHILKINEELLKT
jgi:hypothetical protein